MGEEIDPDEARRQMAERHFMLSQAVIERFEDLVKVLDEAATALEGTGHASLAKTARDEADQTREEIQEWEGFRDEVAAYLEDDA